MTDYDRAEPCWLTKSAVFELAEEVATDLDFEPGDNIYKTVTSLGGRVKIEDLLSRHPEECGTLYVDGPEDFKIIVPSHTSPVRDRFTIAHELGHYFLHYLLKFDEEEIAGKKLIAYRKDSERVEWEANWFAAAFLMPAQRFEATYHRYNGILTQIAEEFCVSTAAANNRAKALQLKQ